MVVANNPLTTDPTGDGMVSQAGAYHPALTHGAFPLEGEDLEAETVLAAATNSDLWKWRPRDLLDSAENKSLPHP